MYEVSVNTNCACNSIVHIQACQYKNGNKGMYKASVSRKDLHVSARHKHMFPSQWETTNISSGIFKMMIVAVQMQEEETDVVCVSVCVFSGHRQRKQHPQQPAVSQTCTFTVMVVTVSTRLTTFLLPAS